MNITQQLQSLVTFTGHIRRLTEAIEPSFPTPSIALGTVLNQIGFLVEERAIRKSFVSAFALYRLIAPSLADLLTTLREHDNDLIPSISPPEVDLLRFRRAIGHIRMQLTDDEYTTIPGLPHPFFELHAADYLATHKQTPSPTFPTLNQPFHGFDVNSNDDDESTDDMDMEEAAGMDANHE
jgi:hypothetical protein